MPLWSRVSILDLTFRLPTGKSVAAPCLIVDGDVSPLVTKWLVEEAQNVGGIGRGASLERFAQAMKRLAQFHLCYGESRIGRELLIDFSSALDAGDRTLGWKPLRFQSGDSYFKAVCQFCDWAAQQSEFRSFEHPNPHSAVIQQGLAQANDGARRREHDLLFHLYSATRAGKGLRLVRRIRHQTRFNKQRAAYAETRIRDQQPIQRRPKGMPFPDFLKLLTFEKEARRMLMWLMLGGGACRVSEALQTFASDVHWDEQSGEAVVALVNPIKGLVSADREGTFIERRAYLAKRYGLRPRCDLPKSDPRFAGWKGMVEGGFSTDDRPFVEKWHNRRWTPMQFLLPVFGRLFWRAHKIYLRQRAHMAVDHPYYFINMTRNVGAPVTRSSVEQLLASSCRRAGIPVIRPHALRHMYGNCLSDWDIPIHEAQLFMRHSSIRSTLVYYPLPRRPIRTGLARVESERRRREIEQGVPNYTSMIGARLEGETL